LWRITMARMTRTSLALVAVAVVAPLSTEAQNWTAQTINGLVVYDRAGTGWRQRAVEMQYGWYYETTYLDANQLVTAMMFSEPQWQKADRVDYVRDDNGDHVMDNGWQWIVGRGYVQWAVTEIASYR